TIEFQLAAPHGGGPRFVADLVVLPKHILHRALQGGTLSTTWSMATPANQVVGAGPFVIREYVPGQRLSFVRNPHFFETDDNGHPLPYLDGIEVQIVPDANTE